MVDGEVLTLHCEGLTCCPPRSTSCIRNISMPEQKAPNCARSRKHRFGRRIIAILLVVAAFALAVVLGFRKRASRLDAFAQWPIGQAKPKCNGRMVSALRHQKESSGRSFRYIRTSNAASRLA